MAEGEFERRVSQHVKNLLEENKAIKELLAELQQRTGSRRAPPLPYGPNNPMVAQPYSVPVRVDSINAEDRQFTGLRQTSSVNSLTKDDSQLAGKPITAFVPEGAAMPAMDRMAFVTFLGNAAPIKYMMVSGPSGQIPGKIVEVAGGSPPEPEENTVYDYYTCDLFESGVSQEKTDTRTVRQLQIGAGEVIPADTWVSVSLSGDEHVMQVPTWL